MKGSFIQFPGVYILNSEATFSNLIKRKKKLLKKCRTNLEVESIYFLKSH